MFVYFLKEMVIKNKQKLRKEMLESAHKSTQISNNILTGMSNFKNSELCFNIGHFILSDQIKIITVNGITAIKWFCLTLKAQSA